ncbi:MAG: glycosyltransferase family 39 protein, partial [Phycisphaerae bacterium]|nr:glycosyltransferase family 39 protein [Phycisphaerae bacterium]
MIEPQAHPAGSWVESHFRPMVAVVCSVYLVPAVILAVRFPLHMDEFQYAWFAWKIGQSLPYQDIHPLKPLLGFYLIRGGLHLAQDPWLALIAVRLAMAAVNAIALACLAVALGRLYGRVPGLLAVLLLAMMSTFILHSVAIRVDLPGTWCAVAALLLLVSGKHLPAGLLAGLGLLFTQKAGYFILASNLGLAG